MKRRIRGLRETTSDGGPDVPDGVYLVRVDRAQYRRHPQKPFYALRLSVLEPRELAGWAISGRLYCSARAVWKLGWFLCGFLYDPELLSQDEVDEKALSGLRGVVKISQTTVHSPAQLRQLRPANQWEALSAVSSLGNGKREVA
jgi:hypothetical protein